MKKKLLVLASVLGFCAFNCSANTGPTDNSNFYVSGAFGYADSGWSYANYDSTGLGLDVMGGYRYNQYWAFEGGFTHLPKSTNSTGEIDTNAWSMFTRIRLPINLPNIDFYTKVGLGYLMSSDDVDNTDLALGLGYGFEYSVKPNINLEGQYTHYIGNYGSSGLPNADYYSVGLLYFLPKNFAG